MLCSKCLDLTPIQKNSCENILSRTLWMMLPPLGADYNLSLYLSRVQRNSLYGQEENILASLSYPFKRVSIPALRAVRQQYSFVTYEGKGIEKG